MKKNKNTGLPKAIFLSAHEKKKAELVLPGLEEIPAVNSSNASSGHSAPPENQAAKKPSRRGAAKSKKETPPTEKARHWKNFTYDLPPPPRPHAKKAGKREVGALLKDPRASHASAASGSGFKKKALIAGGTIALLGVTAILTLPLTSDEPREMASEAKVPSEENKTALAVKPTQDPLAYKREGIGDKAIPETLPEAAAKLFAAAEAAEEEKPALPSLASYRMFIPKKGRDLVHTLPEIRWCLREGIILDLLAAKLPASEFDVQAKPFNERCLNYRYFESDMDHARKDVEDIEGTIREEALKRVDLRGTAVLEETGNKKLTEKDEVVYVQELLVRLGFGLRIDGVLGARTVKAIKRIQSKAGMELTGTVSARLIQELEKIISQ